MGKVIYERFLTAEELASEKPFTVSSHASRKPSDSGRSGSGSNTPTSTTASPGPTGSDTRPRPASIDDIPRPSEEDRKRIASLTPEQAEDLVKDLM